jgi:hypothetical protein
MRKLLTFIAVMALTAPAFASVTFYVDPCTPGEATITYTYTEPQADGPVGMAIVVDCSSGQIDALEDIDSFFDVFIDFARDEEVGGDGYDPYGEGSSDPDNAASKVSSPGVETMPSSQFVISIAGLGGTDPCTITPPPGGTVTLCKLKSDAGAEVCITLDDGYRGPVVNKSGAMTSNLDSSAQICFTIDPENPCPEIPPDKIAQWQAYGEPANWCNECWMEGDVNGDCLITFSADVMTVYNDLLTGNTSGRSDWNMDGLMTCSADVMGVYNMLLASST